jgi:hypothetical protein
MSRITSAYRGKDEIEKGGMSGLRAAARRSALQEGSAAGGVAAALAALEPSSYACAKPCDPLVDELVRGEVTTRQHKAAQQVVHAIVTRQQRKASSQSARQPHRNARTRAVRGPPRPSQRSTHAGPHERP